MTTDQQQNSLLSKTGITAVLSFGSNCGEREKNVQNALDWMKQNFSETRVSEVYETPEVHGIGNHYINAVGICKVKGSLSELITFAKRYEVENGRDADCRKRGDVPIDIDVVLWGDNIVRPLDYSSSFFKIGYAMLSKD